jgi:hypothetical protein
MTTDQIVKPNWRRVLAIFAALLAFMLVVLCTACAPRMCKRTPIVITSHPTKPRPAGRVTVSCDDQTVADILADEVVP